MIESKICVVCNLLLPGEAYHNHKSRSIVRCRKCVAARLKLKREGVAEPSWSEIRDVSLELVLKSSNQYKSSMLDKELPPPKRVRSGASYWKCVYCGKSLGVQSRLEAHAPVCSQYIRMMAEL